MLRQVLPAALVPYVPVLLGGLALVLGVHGVRKGPDPRAVSAPLDTVAEAATEPAAATGAAVSAASPPAATAAAEPAAPAAPFWTGVQPGAPTTSTSILQVPDVPAVSYQ